ncbi:MAG: HAMP domain-containing sensor histidine kinase, partial [Candidatus Omnitrophota bacterium]
AGNRMVGNIIVMRDVTAQENSLIKLCVFLACACLLLGGFLVLFFYIYLGRIESELNRAENKLKEAAEIKSQFTSMVSHELRTPLGPIKEGVSIVLDGLTGEINDEQRDLLQTAKNNADRLNLLINDVLDFQKLESGRMRLNIEMNDINEAVKEVHDAMSLVSQKKGLGFSLELDPDIPGAFFDKERIIQVLTNLVSNAVKFTEKGGITIKTTRDHIGSGEAVHVAVCDTGPGIRKEDIPKLFRSFQQLDMPRTRKAGGTGLGLVISKEIIARHGGKIWAESEYGKGSAFHFTLPAGKTGAVKPSQKSPGFSRGDE